MPAREVRVALISHSWNPTTGAAKCAVELNDLLRAHPGVRMVEEGFVEPPPGGALRKLEHKLRRAAKLWRLFRRTRPDVVIVNTTVQSSVVLVSRVAGCRVVWWCHESEPALMASWLTRSRVRIYKALTHAVVVVSRAAPPTRRPTVAIRNIVENHIEPKQDGPPVLLVMGSKGWQKGTDLLPLLLDPALAHRTSELWLVGNEEHTDRDLIRTARADLESTWGARLRWLPPVDDVHDMYRRAAILLLPSRQETRPRAVEEALAHGVPVVASRLPGLLDIEDSVTQPGALTLVGLDEDWTSAIESALSAGLPRTSFIKEFTAEEFAAAWLRVIRCQVGH